MTTKESILLAARVPREAWQTTLPAMQLPQLREYVVAGSTAPVVVAPADTRSAPRAAQATYVLAKELALSGKTKLLCLTLSELVSLVFQSEESFRSIALSGVHPDTLSKLDALVVTSFVDSSPAFLPGAQQYYLASLLLGHMRKGGTLVLGKDSTDPLHHWWPTQFSAYVNLHGAVHTIPRGL